jgi:nucleotide-binding universal stress UspA family protein
MAPRHVALCYLGTADDEQLLRRAAELAARSGARLSLVLPIVDGAIPDGCCGIQAEHWQRLVEEDARGAAQRAVQCLEEFGCPPVNVALELGPSLAEIARRAAARYGCDVIAVGRKRPPWSSAGMSRRHVNALRAACPQEVVELLPAGRNGLTSSRSSSRPSPTSASL